MFAATHGWMCVPMAGKRLRCCATKAYDLIVADWELPGIDGLSLLRNVRQQRRSPALPFILLSSRNDSASVREALPLAPTAYLTKPLNMEGLTQRLQDLLLNEGESVYCEVPRLAPGMTLPVFLERRRDACDGAPLWVDVKAAVQDSLGPEGLDLNRLEDRGAHGPADHRRADCRRQQRGQSRHAGADPVGGAAYAAGRAKHEPDPRPGPQAQRGVG